MRKKSFYERFLKRPMDFTLSLIALILLSPILLVIALLVRINLGSPIVFKQPRPGLNEKIFMLYKFRTMTDKKDNNGNLLPDSIRLTKFGKFLRSTSLDELPSLVNIIVGDLSIVGPRPQLIKDMCFMTEEQRMRHKVRPGLTGLAQISGRNAISWDAKLKYDLIYLEKISFSKDVYIIFLTIFKVLRRQGISADGLDTSDDYAEYLLKTGKITTEEYSKKIREVISNE